MQTIGERLEEARKKKGASIREAAEGTKVRGEYLQKFENNQFDIGLSDLYVRGFLRSYAIFLKLPDDRILNDYAALGHGEVRPRQPSREVYGRMEVSVASADDAGESPAAAADAGGKTAAGEPARPAPHMPRNRGPVALRTGINPALVFKGLIALVFVLVAILILWAVKSLVGGSAPAAANRAAITSAPAQPAADSTVAIVATDSVRIKVVRQSDGTELYQGPLARGERREFPNVPLYLTSSALESVVIEYKGRQYPTHLSGHNRVAIDLSNR